MKIKGKDIRGYSLDIAITFLNHRVEMNIHPFQWNKPMLCVPLVGHGLKNWHFNFGCFHLWGMSSSNLFSIELNYDYLHFWWDKPKCPETMKQIF